MITNFNKDEGDFLALLELVKERVVIHDLMDMAQPPVKYDSRIIESQINCPFHGRDVHKSCRVYPKSNSMYCWFCDKSWDVVDFWAEVNGWWTSKDKRNIKRAVDDLCYRYNLRSVKPDWRKKLETSLSNIESRKGGYDTVGDDERLRLKNFYQWRIATQLRPIDTEQRKERWDTVKNVWDALDDIDVKMPGWKQQLVEWNQVAGMVITSEDNDEERQENPLRKYLDDRRKSQESSQEEKLDVL
jgi:hypothetical protein